MPNICIYHYSTVMIFGIAPLGFLIVLFVTVEMGFLYFSYKETSRAVMSPKVKKMQRQFLLQLGLQAFIPIIAIIVPTVAVIFVFSFGVLGYSCKLYFSYVIDFLAVLIDCIFLVMSTFGSIGGVVLIVMNPTYWNWCYKFSHKNNTGLLSTVRVRERSTMRVN